MFYIHQTTCISAQQTFPFTGFDQMIDLKDKRFLAIEPVYDAIPSASLRRMGKSVRMGLGAAIPLMKNNVAGIIIGTANGGKEDCVKFLSQVKDYDEGLLTPINFVQSTPNAVAAQIGSFAKNHGYNITHLHLGLAFEFAMIDVDMLLEEDAGKNYLLGGVDDISAFNYYFEDKDGWYKKDISSNMELYASDSTGTVAGEAACMFLVNAVATNAIANVAGIETIHTDDEFSVVEKMYKFLETHLTAEEKIDLMLSGENGDNRLLKYYEACENGLGENVSIARFKHMSGEYPTASAMAVWICCEILNKQPLPAHMIKRKVNTSFKNVLIYNNYKGLQHSFILVRLSN